MITIGSCFSGIGGMELGLETAFEGRAKTIWQCEKNPFCRSILKRHWPEAKIYDDIETIQDPAPVDILVGGPPCQDISRAGKCEGLDGEKSRLYWSFWRLCRDLRPRIAIIENVSDLAFRGLDAVVSSLADLRYDVEWETVRASSLGMRHRRERIFIVAYSDMSREFPLPVNGALPRTPESLGIHANISPFRTGRRLANIHPFYRSGDGIPAELDRHQRLTALGNAICPAQSFYIGRKLVESGLIR